ncbi:MAG: 3-keto-5-aminohexanoate cleavage protein [Bdellovibrionota bacterium]
MATKNKTIITCALTGVLTDPEVTGVPVTPAQMAQEALDAYNAGATIVHCHFRQQEAGKTHLASWDPDVAFDTIAAIRAKVPKLLINMSTGVIGPDISDALACLKKVKPEIAALNAGTLNYLKIKKDGSWAWPPFIFDNPVDKIQKYIKVMNEFNILPECECFDTGIVRSVAMFEKNGLLKKPVCVSFVMGVSSGMPAKPAWLSLLVDELNPGAHWQVIGIGREEVWPLLQKAIDLGGDVRTGLEDHFYLPDGKKTRSNGALVAALAQMVKKSGAQIASPEETKEKLGIK